MLKVELTWNVDCCWNGSGFSNLCWFTDVNQELLGMVGEIFDLLISCNRNGTHIFSARTQTKHKCDGKNAIQGFFSHVVKFISQEMRNENSNSLDGDKVG